MLNMELGRIVKEITLVFFLTFTGRFVVSQTLIQSDEENSSPAHIIVRKGSSVWLNWQYSYSGDGKHGHVSYAYKQQTIIFINESDSVMQVLARRIGENGILTLESPTPPPFNGRVEVISSNSTLVIHHIQYDDSSFRFTSLIDVLWTVDFHEHDSKYNLKPNVTLEVQGTPKFSTQPPSTLEVKERSKLVLRIDMKANPQPSADFRWTHHNVTSSTAVPGVQSHPFVYTSLYTLGNIDASYCGRILQTTIKNSVGSLVKNTAVTVLLSLNFPLAVKAEKLHEPRCITIEWNKVESGACFVKYDVTFKNASGHSLHTQTGYNIGGMNVCNLTAYVNITNVQLVVSFKSTSKSVTAELSETPITTAPPTAGTANFSTIVTTTINRSTQQSMGASTNSTFQNPTPKSKPGDPNIGVIVGIVAGVVFGLLLLAIIYRFRTNRGPRWCTSQPATEAEMASLSILH